MNADAKLHRLVRQMALYGLNDQQIEVVLGLIEEYIVTLHNESVAEVQRLMDLARTATDMKGGQA